MKKHIQIKHFLMLLLILFLSGNRVFAQSTWFWQNPKPQGNHLFHVKLVSPTTGFAVGDAATIMKTTNAGINWTFTHYTAGSTKILRSLFFIDENNGWAGGYEGTLLHTTNSGVSWNIVPASIGQIVQGIYFSSMNTGTLVTANQSTNCCGGIFRTTDGGSDWILFPQPAPRNLEDVAMANDNFGIAVGLNGTMLKTTDGGNSWIQINGGTLEQLFAIDHVGDSLWIVAGNGGKIIKSTDKGVTWFEQINGTELFFEGIDFVDANTGYVCGSNGAIYKTTNGGTNWTHQQSGTPNSLFDISFADANTGIAVGLYGTIVRTTNGGSTWITVSEGPVNGLFASDFPLTQSGYLVGENGIILKTTNAGGIWQPLTSGVSENLFAVSFLNINTGIAVGSSGAIIKTTNGGAQWNLQQSNVNGNLAGVAYINSNLGFVSGYNENNNTSVILKTTNGGGTWTNTLTGFTNILRNVGFFDENAGIAVGGMGTILVTTNSGNSWQNKPQQQFSLISVEIVSNSFAAVSGFDVFSSTPTGIFLVTTDKGNSWVDRSAGLDVPINGISFINEHTGIAVGFDGSIFKTGNGGINWSKGGLTGTGSGLNGVNYVGTDSIIVFGGGGNILASFNNTVLGIGNGGHTQISSDFHISQNYPNPFNPATTIKFQVPNSSYVRLTVFDVLGRLVSTLADGKFSPGVHSVSWDASNYPSGIYFYRLESGNYSESKKMLLIK
jgi:photosystem II stability/assembly factor-like uncharacterized protein